MQHVRLIVKALYFAVFPINVTSLEFNIADFECLYCNSVLPKCSPAVSSCAKFKVFTVFDICERSILCFTTDYTFYI